MRCWFCRLFLLNVSSSWIDLLAAARQSNRLARTLGFGCACWSWLVLCLALLDLNTSSWLDTRCNSITASRYAKCIMTTETYCSSEHVIGCSGRISMGKPSRQRLRWLSSLPSTFIRSTSDLVCELAEYNSLHIRLRMIANITWSRNMS